MSVNRAPSDGLPLPHRRLVMWLGVLTLVLSLITPLVSVEVADAAAAAAELAQGEPPNCDPGYVVDEATNTCVEDPNAQLQPQCEQGEVVDPNTGECVPDPNLQPVCDPGFVYNEQTAQCEPEEPQCEPGTVLNEQTGQCEPEEQPVTVGVTKWECPPDASGYAQDFGQLQANCFQPTQAYPMYYIGPDGPSSLFNVQGDSQWPDLPPGDYYIGEEIPANYTVSAWCAGWDPSSGGPNYQSLPVDQTGLLSLPLTLASGWTGHCNWYNIPSGGSITVYKWQCVEDTEFGRELDYYQGALPDQETGPCETEHLNIPITLTDATGPHAQPNTTQANGTQFDGVIPDQAGSFQIAIQEPEGYGDPMVWCWPVDGDPPTNPIAAPGGIFTVTTGPAPFSWQCVVYDVPAQVNSITVYKWECEPGTEYGRELEYYQGGLPDQETGPCESEHLNIPIHLIHGGPQQDTTTQANGTQFDDVVLANGSFQIQIEEPDGFGDPMVFCATLDQDTQTPVTATGGTFTITPTGEPFTYQCNVYDIPTGGETGQIVVEKYWCPPGLAFVQAPTRADMMQACQEANPGGVTFELTGPAGNEQQWPSQEAQGGPPANVFWGDLPPGDYTITETGIGEGWTSMVFCHASSGAENGVADEPALSGPAIQRTLQAGYTIDCAWFNQPPADNENSVTVYKWECIEGTEFGQTQAYYQGEGQDQGPCETEHLNIPISLIHGGPQQDTITQANGTQFDDVVLTNGSFSIFIDEPDGFGDPMVFCGTLDDEQQTPYPAPGGTWTITPAGEPFTYQCNVYDVPSTGNSITVYKWDCEPGTEYGRELEYYQGGLPDQETGPCETEHLNIPISLIHGGPQQDTTTQANGTQFNDVVLANGSFQIAITEPAGYGDPMVFCATLDQDTQTPVTATGGTFTITPTGEPFTYQCNVYDIPYEGDYVIDLYKYVCTADVDPSGGLPDLGTNPNCTPWEGIPFTATFGTDPSVAQMTDANGFAHWSSSTGGDWWLQEQLVNGYAPPKVFCGPPQSAETPEYPVTDLRVSGTFEGELTHIVCYWFNFEQEYENGNITVYKYQCPPGTEPADFGVMAETCTTPFNGVDFTLDGPGGTKSAATAGGRVDWYNLDQGDYTITETLLPGYEAPVVWCGYVMQDGVEFDPANQQFTGYPVTDGAIQVSLENFPARLVCYWYNLPAEPGEITIYKWLCPPGYDLGAWGADPKADCTTAQDGVTFTLDQPEGVDLQTNTGDSVPGAVYFGGLNPGAYTVTETVPADIDYVFVLDCTGTNIPKVHPVPLSWGPVLKVNLGAADSIVCNWYNVPRPDFGWVTVYKYVCTTTTYVSKVNCQIYEGGQTFELFGMPGSVSKGTGTTNAGGTYTWENLDQGAYTITEQGGVPCKMTATKTDGKGNAWVDAGKGTTINVYNCTKEPGKVPPGKPPGKYPNTGVGPEDADSFLPSMQDPGTATPGVDAEVFYEVDCLNQDAGAGTPAPATPGVEGTAPPIEPEPTEVPAGAEVTPTPAAESTPAAEGDCERGAVPQNLSIESIGVDADVEFLEIVDGQMEQPTGPELVAWYKDTARLGETNNVVIAGHLNWWNVPEGVFFRLQDMQEGDQIQVTGDDGMVYTYEVRSVTQESNLEAPSVDVIGPTEEPTLTLITCGGEWNADIAEYDERTVVRAVQVDVQPAEAASGT